MNKFYSLTTYLLLLLLCSISTTTLAQTSSRDEIIFFFNDAQGSAVAAVNESGDLCWREEYTPYGDKNINDDLVNEVGCGIVGEERGFTGHTEDVNSDLVYMQQRYYDPSIGRFLSVDPREANPDNPMTYNRYAYANNNPYKYTDPNGEIPLAVWGVYVGVQAALTAYDSYKAYQEGGPTALAKQAAVDIALSAAGAKLAAKAAEGAVAGAKALDAVEDVATGGTKIPNCDLCGPPNKRGNAPIGNDGHPVELHHRNQKPEGPLDEMTRTDHRLGDNFKRNHPNTGQESSQIDRKEWRKEQKSYWKNEWDDGRFDDM